jgi:hypothetical protein
MSAPTLSRKKTLSDFRIDHALLQIKSDFGVSVSVESKKKQLAKFGKNDSVGTGGATVMTLAGSETDETYVNRNLITHFASSSSSDAMVLSVEGHTVGDDESVSTLTQSSGTATCTTSGAHGYSTNDWVYVEGANETEYNGIVQVTVTSTTVFTYTVDSGATSPATGTITATNQDKTFSVQDATLAGQTKTALTTPLARVTRAYVKSQNRATDLVGDIYIAEDVTFTSGVPGTNSAVHLMIPNGRNQSEKCATSISSSDYWIVTEFEAAVLTKSGTIYADVDLEALRIGGVWRILEDLAVTNQSGSIIVPLDPPIIVPANAEVRARAVSSTSNTSIEAVIRGYLAN